MSKTWKDRFISRKEKDDTWKHEKVQKSRNKRTKVKDKINRRDWQELDDLETFEKI